LRRLTGRGGSSDADALALLVGLASWGTHTLLDFNFQIPGTLLLAATMPLYVPMGWQPVTLAPKEDEGRSGKAAWLALAGVALLSLASLWRVPGEAAYQRLHSWYERPQATVGYIRRLAEDASARLPLSPYPWVLLGRVAQRKERPDVAVEAYRKASMRAPHRAAFHTHLCENFLALGDEESAKEALSHALEWYPHDRDILALQRALSE